MTTEVLRYTQSLCEALETDYRLYTVRSHRNSINKNIDDWSVSYHQEQLDKIREGSYDFGYTFTIDEGKKYLKVVMISHGSRSVHAFVDKKTGEVYKSASWKAPAKGVRYNLMDTVSRDNCYRLADWAGTYLYKR
jgi:hypothetical protein